MKRGRFDADYERVARKPPPKSVEFPEAGDDDLFERERASRIAASNADFRERMTQLAVQERQQEAERKARADATTMRANMSAMMQEYRRAGVTPPFVNEDGTPRCSLSMLINLGWSIEELNGTVTLIRTLIRPQRLAYDRPSQERSDNRPKPAAKEDANPKAAD